MRPCREPGVLLVADSWMTNMNTDGTLFNEVTTRKILYLAGTETAVIISGNVNDDELEANGFLSEYRPLMPGLPQEADPRNRIRRAFGAIQRIDATVRARHPGADRYAEIDHLAPPHALFAAPGLLGRFTSQGETWAEPGDVLVIGGWLLGMPSQIGLEMQLPAPDTLEECKALATEWVTRFVDEVFGYRDPAEQVRATGGTSPCIGGPLQMLTLTSDELLREEVEL